MTRTRTTVEGLEVMSLTTLSKASDTVNDKGEQIKYSLTSTMTDVVTPFHRRKMAQGVIINNPVTMRVVELSNPESSSNSDSIGNPGAGSVTLTGSIFLNWHENFNAYGSLSATDYSDGISIAKLHALANIDPTPYSFAEDLAELSSTFVWLKRRAHSFEKAARRYKKEVKKLKRKASRLKHLSKADKAKWLATEMSNLWLETRFVISPFVRSLMDLMEAYNHTPAVRPPRMTSRGKYETDSHEDGVKDTTLSNSLILHSKWKHDQEADIRAGILYKVSNPVEGFRFKYGLRNKDIPVTLWNVVRLSFMVDRVIDISSAIKAVTNLADPDIKILAAWVTQRRSRKITYRYTDVTDPRAAPSDWSVSGPDQFERTFDYIRNPWAPTLSDAIPPVTLAKLVKDVTSTVDLLALGISFLGFK